MPNSSTDEKDTDGNTPAKPEKEDDEPESIFTVPTTPTFIPDQEKNIDTTIEFEDEEINLDDDSMDAIVDS